MYKYKIIIDTCLSCYKTKEIEYETEPTEQQIEDSDYPLWLLEQTFYRTFGFKLCA